MTCASCAARVEEKLNRMDGVTATVDYATEKARISYGAGAEVTDLISAVVRTGHTAEEPAPPAPATAPEGTPEGTPTEPSGDRELSALRHRLPVCVLRPASCVLIIACPRALGLATRPPSWSAPGGAPSSASSSRAPRSWGTPAGPTPSRSPPSARAWRWARARRSRRAI
ncbi:heavy metal translocating P-type ATPase [Streptomyces sp. NPDC048734]|uniref:heavy-metal-associated domain-containing protein n=1 Tax=Streptomyces sp. NPDC048734 TaxID=3365590 RepID=UPI00371CB9E4